MNSLVYAPGHSMASVYNITCFYLIPPVFLQDVLWKNKPLFRDSKIYIFPLLLLFFLLPFLGKYYYFKNREFFITRYVNTGKGERHVEYTFSLFSLETLMSLLVFYMVL